MGRFINADAFASTGQGILGNNMFAYCNNNVVCFSDDSGQAPSTDIYPVCIGGNGYRLVSGTSDGEEKSNELLQAVSSKFLPRVQSTLFINVDYLGTYTHQNDSTLNTAFAVGGGLTLLLLIPPVRKCVLASKLLSAIGYASSAYGLACLLPEYSLPEKDYHYYRVTVSWTEKTPLAGYPNVYVLVKYHVEMWFIYNDNNHAYQTWYLLDSNWSETRSNHE